MNEDVSPIKNGGFSLNAEVIFACGLNQTPCKNTLMSWQMPGGLAPLHGRLDEKTSSWWSPILVDWKHSKIKIPGCLGYFHRDEKLPSYVGIYQINHEIRVPSLNNRQELEFCWFHFFSFLDYWHVFITSWSTLGQFRDKTRQTRYSQLELLGEDENAWSDVPNNTREVVTFECDIASKDSFILGQVFRIAYRTILTSC